MKRYASVLTAALIGLLLLTSLQAAAVKASDSKRNPTLPNRVSHGKFLVSVGACNDCHTPWKMGPHGAEPDMTRFLSGHPEGVKMPSPPQPSGPWTWFGAATNTAYAGPWGVSYAPNLTPDQNTGLGIWTEEMFVKAIKTGKHFGTSREIMPPMPWDSYRNYSEGDLKAIYAYLQTIPAIVNHVPDSEPPPPPASPARKK